MRSAGLVDGIGRARGTRLAERLGGSPVVFVKSRTAAKSATAEELGRKGIVDAAFAGIVRRGGLRWQIVGLGGGGS